MDNYNNHIINENLSIIQIIEKLNSINGHKILFVVKKGNILLGSITDGDIRRGIVNGINNLDDKGTLIMNFKPSFLFEKNFQHDKLSLYKKQGLKIIPILNSQNQIVDFLDLKIKKSYLDIDTVIMAGGKGTRLRPMTNNIPKPLLKIAGKPIIQHVIDHLDRFMVKKLWITVNYKSDEIKNFFHNQSLNHLKINFIKETFPMGTIGSVTKIKNFTSDYVLILNGDLITNINFEEFYLKCIKSNADIGIVSVPYNVSIPYAVLETKGENVKRLKEKPTYQYQSNGGMYLIKKEIFKHIPDNSFYNVTDLIDKIIRLNFKVIFYSFFDYWLDIGKPEDFEKGIKEFNNIKF